MIRAVSPFLRMLRGLLKLDTGRGAMIATWLFHGPWIIGQSDNGSLGMALQLHLSLSFSVTMICALSQFPYTYMLYGQASQVALM